MGAHFFQLLTNKGGVFGQAQHGTVCHFVPETRTSAVYVTSNSGHYYPYGLIQMLHETGHILGLDNIDEKNDNDTCRVNDG